MKHPRTEPITHRCWDSRSRRGLEFIPGTEYKPCPHSPAGSGLAVPVGAGEVSLVSPLRPRWCRWAASVLTSPVSVNGALSTGGGVRIQPASGSWSPAEVPWHRGTPGP